MVFKRLREDLATKQAVRKEAKEQARAIFFDEFKKETIAFEKKRAKQQAIREARTPTSERFEKRAVQIGKGLGQTVREVKKGFAPLGKPMKRKTTKKGKREKKSDPFGLGDFGMGF